MSKTIPLSVPDDLLEEVHATADQTHLSIQDVFRQSTRLGLPRLREQHATVSARLTNVEPLPDNILDQLYRDREEDDASIRQLIAAQPKGVE